MLSINRNAVLIKPKEPFLEWINSLPGEHLDLDIERLRSDCTVLLIPEVASANEATAYIEDMHKEVLEMELESWYRDESLWPKRRTLKMLRDWFDIEVHSMIFDVLDEEIEKN